MAKELTVGDYVRDFVKPCEWRPFATRGFVQLQCYDIRRQATREFAVLDPDDADRLADQLHAMAKVARADGD